MSAIPSNPFPTPGLVLLVQLGSWVPKGVVKGEPMSNPCPTISLQFVPCTNPTCAQVNSLNPIAFGAEPGNERYCDAMLPAGADFSKDGVSYHALEMFVCA